ncbi:MAG TPA: TSUP family transporter [Kofleriaceae bacterium]|nr:TSUP family transporter [Kofleriaceae bacterium]
MPDAFTIALLAVAALGAGTVDAIAGGGGLITVPALLAAGLPTHAALATNKGQSVWGSGAAMLTFWRHGRLDLAKARVTFPLGLLGACGGTAAVLAVSPDALRPIVIGMLVFAVVVLLVRKPERASDHPVAHRLAKAGAIALVIGAYDGFFGPGTGTFLIVGFVVICGETPTAATADAKVVNFASNCAALTLFAIERRVIWRIALPMAAAQLCGGFLGAKLAVKGGARLVRGMVVVVSLALCAKLARDLYLSGW